MSSVKRLGQLLLEQQEPFALDVYLLESGYSKNRSNSTTKSCNGTETSLGFLKRSIKYIINRRKKVTPTCSELVKIIFNKSLIKTGKNSRGLAVAVEERMSSANSLNSCSQSETTSPQQKQQISEEVDRDKKLQRECMEDNKQQLSPISVLDKTSSNQFSTIYNDDAEKQRVKKTRKIERAAVVCNTDTAIKKTNETIYSVTLSKLLGQSSTEKPNFSADYMKIKLALRETKQLLFDCVKEVIETYRWKKEKKQEYVKEFLGAEEIGKILHDNVIEWSKQTTYGTNIRRLLNVDLIASFEEKDNDNLQQQRKEICLAIGDFISEDLILEIVADMVFSIPQLAPH